MKLFTGVRYIKDISAGNCSVFPISSTSFSDYEAKGVVYANGSAKDGYIAHMKNPLQFFFLDSSYVYTGSVSDILNTLIYYHIWGVFCVGISFAVLN